MAAISTRLQHSTLSKVLCGWGRTELKLAFRGASLRGCLARLSSLHTMHMVRPPVHIRKSWGRSHNSIWRVSPSHWKRAGSDAHRRHTYMQSSLLQAVDTLRIHTTV